MLATRVLSHRWRPSARKEIGVRYDARPAGRALLQLGGQARRIGAVVTLHTVDAMLAMPANGVATAIAVSVGSHGMAFGAPSLPQWSRRRRTEGNVQGMGGKPGLGREKPLAMSGVVGIEARLMAGATDLNDEIARSVVYSADASTRHFPSIGTFK